MRATFISSQSVDITVKKMSEARQAYAIHPGVNILEDFGACWQIYATMVQHDTNDAINDAYLKFVFDKYKVVGDQSIELHKLRSEAK